VGFLASYCIITPDENPLAPFSKGGKKDFFILIIILTFVEFILNKGKMSKKKIKVSVQFLLRCCQPRLGWLFFYSNVWETGVGADVQHLEDVGHLIEINCNKHLLIPTNIQLFTIITAKPVFTGFFFN